MPPLVDVPLPTPTPPLSFASLQISSLLLPFSSSYSPVIRLLFHPPPTLLFLSPTSISFQTAIIPFSTQRKGGKEEEETIYLIWAASDHLHPATNPPTQQPKLASNVPPLKGLGSIKTVTKKRCNWETKKKTSKLEVVN